MRTNEMINDQLKVIDWEFISIYEEHDNNWCCWQLKGIDQEGKEYEATCQADKNNPSNHHSDIEDIDLV